MPGEMMKISAAQNRAYFKANPDQLVTLVEDDLRERHPRRIEGIDDVSLREMIVNAIQRGRKNQLTDPRDLAGFALLSFSIAPNFDEQPRIRQAFAKMRDRSGAVLGEVVEAAGAEAWDAAERAYDSAAWFSELDDDE